MAKKWIGLVLCMVLAFGLAACTDGTSSSQPAAQSTAQPEAQPAASEAQPEEPEEPEAPAPSANGIGDTAEVDGVSITLVSINESDGGKYAGPDEGNIYLLCEFLVENNTEEEITISSMLCFDAYVDDFSTSISLSAALNAENGTIDGSVAAGKKLQGAIGFEVSEDWQSLEVIFTPAAFGKNNVSFEVEK